MNLALVSCTRNRGSFHFWLCFTVQNRPFWSRLLHGRPKATTASRGPPESPQKCNLGWQKSACGNANSNTRLLKIKKCNFGWKQQMPAATPTSNTGLLKLKISQIIVTLLRNNFHMGRYGLILSVSEAYIDFIAFGTSFDPISAYNKNQKLNKW